MTAGVLTGCSFNFASFVEGGVATTTGAGVGAGAGLGVGGAAIVGFLVPGGLPVSETFVVRFGISGTFSAGLVGVCLFAETLLVETLDLTDACEEGRLGVTFPLGLDSEAVEITDASEVFRGRSALGVLTTKFPLTLPWVRPAALVDPPSVFILRVDVVEAIEVALGLGTSGMSNSDLALLNDVDTSDTRELGLERLDAKEARGVDLFAPAVVEVAAVLLRGSALTLRVLFATLGLGATGETAAFVVDAPPLRIVDVVDFTDAAIDLGLLAAGLSLAAVVSFLTFRRAGTFLAGLAGIGSIRWFPEVVAESSVFDLEKVAPVSFWVTMAAEVTLEFSWLRPLCAEEKEVAREWVSLSVVVSRFRAWRDIRTGGNGSRLGTSSGLVAFDLARFRFRTLARMEVAEMLASSASAPALSFGIVTCKPVRVVGPLALAGASRSGILISSSRDGGQTRR